MKKPLLFAALLMGAYFTTNAQTVLFEDDFESYDNFIISNIGQWTQIDVDGAPTYGIEVGNPAQTVVFDNSGYTGTGIVFNPAATDPVLGEGYEAYEGDKSLNFIAAVSQNEDDPALVGPNNDWMITPQITLGSTGNTVTFWAKSLTAQYGLERFKIAVSTTANTNPGNFTVISPTTPNAYVEAPIEWTEYTYSLDAFSGQDVYIAINYVSDDAFMMLVDNFAVTTTGTMGTESQLASAFSVSPNPATNIINIANADNMLLTGVSIVDINGRTVKTVSFKNVSEAQINVSDLAAGVYMMNIASDKGTATKKIVKN